MGMNYVGDFAEDQIVHLYFDTFDTAGASEGSPGFVLADVEIYKNGSSVERATTDGITVATNFDGLSGIHRLTVDTGNNTGDAGFWVAQADYLVIVDSLSIDSQTVRFIAGSFSIENRVTDLVRIQGGTVPTPNTTGIPDVNLAEWLDVTPNGVNNGAIEADVQRWLDTAVATPNTAGVPLIDMIRIVGGLVPTPSTTGVPDVNVERWLDTLVTLSAGAPDVNIQSTDDIALSATQQSDVNTQVLDVMNVDTIPELTQAVPSATPTHRAALMLIYMALRNRLDVDTSGGTDHKEIYNDANVVITKKVLTDDGSTYREDKMIIGP